MAQATSTADVARRASKPRGPPPAETQKTSWPRMVLLVLGAVLFLFPFYYMLIASLQAEPDTSLAGAFPTGGFTLDNYRDINGRVNLGRSLANSGIFTGAVILCTVVFGLLAGYALARLHFRGRGSLFAAMLLVQVIPFQLLMIPLYVMIVRSYGLADSYLGMIAPFAINATAVFVFRQFFLQLPEDLFSAARIDGASELRILWSIALPLVRPAVLTAVLLTFIGPWNEFLWPFLITKDAGPATARGLAGQLHRAASPDVRRTPTARSSPAPACWLRPPSSSSWPSRSTSPRRTSGPE